MKQQQEDVNNMEKQEKPTKEKAKTRNNGLTKQEPNNSQTCRNIVVFKHQQLKKKHTHFCGHQKHQSAQLAFLTFRFCGVVWPLLLNNKSQIIAEQSWFKRFFLFC